MNTSVKGESAMISIIDYFDEDAKTHDEKFVRRMDMSSFYNEIERLIRLIRPESMLVIGCGTGLEIERIKHKCRVTALDISSEMLKRLKSKNFHSKITLEAICASALEYDFGKEKYDMALSCYTLHHFNEEQRLILSEKASQSLKVGGVFVNGDIYVENSERENTLLKEANCTYTAENLPFASLHIDVPFTIGHETEIYKHAGFSVVNIEKQWERTVIYKCVK